METRLGPLRLASPIIGAAGAFGLGADLDRLGPEALPAAIVTGSLSYRSRRGPASRILETPGGALWVPAGARTSVRHALRRGARAWAASPCPVVVSLWDGSPEAVAAAAGMLEGERGVAVIEIRIDDMDAVAATVRAVRRACALPVWVKLASDAPGVEDALAAAASAGAAAATVGGGLQGQVDGQAGYLVGPATFPVVLELIQRLACDAPLPLIASGGVATSAHSHAYLAAGADAVQVGSAHLANPHVAAQIAAAMDGHGGRPGDA